MLHSKRCFKKDKTCYADIPAEPCERTEIEFSETTSDWATWDGRKVLKKLFRVKLQRKVEDVFTNIHNPLLTQLFLCNNNVLIAMTGAAVLYVTGYNVKKTQKEERLAFENVGRVLIDTINRQVSQRPYHNRICIITRF